MEQKKMTPQEKSNDMIEAIKYNLDNGLMTTAEVREAKTPKEKYELAMRAVMNRNLHQKSLEMERQKMYGSRTSADENVLREDPTNGRVIRRRTGN